MVRMRCALVILERPAKSHYLRPMRFSLRALFALTLFASLALAFPWRAVTSSESPVLAIVLLLFAVVTMSMGMTAAAMGALAVVDWWMRRFRR